jgi:hypothetical protein
MKKLTLLLSFICNLSYKAQDRVINPILLVAADARAAGMADIGITFGRCFSQQWNPAKYAFATDARGFLLATLT